jgi:hypothetical protein
MKNKLLVLTLLAAGSMFAGISVGINIGAPPPPRVIAVQPVSPGPGYTFVSGYWYPVSGHYRWHEGYWSRPPYEGALWIGPHHDGRQYYAGYWQGPGRERMEHNHRWDRDHDRDYHR